MKVIILFLSLGMSLGSSFAGDLKLGKQKATTCLGCHGPEGMSGNPMFPNLAGQQEEYLVKQLKEFKSGYRKDSTGAMNPLAQILSDEDIENLAAYYASLKER